MEKKLKEKLSKIEHDEEINEIQDSFDEYVDKDYLEQIDEFKDYMEEISCFQFSDFFQPSESQKQGELIFVGTSALALGFAASHFL